LLVSAAVSGAAPLVVSAPTDVGAALPHDRPETAATETAAANRRMLSVAQPPR